MACDLGVMAPAAPGGFESALPLLVSAGANAENCAPCMHRRSGHDLVWPRWVEGLARANARNVGS
jgi:hypothetical protein